MRTRGQTEICRFFFAISETSAMRNKDSTASLSMCVSSSVPDYAVVCFKGIMARKRYLSSIRSMIIPVLKKRKRFDSSFSLHIGRTLEIQKMLDNHKVTRNIKKFTIRLSKVSLKNNKDVNKNVKQPCNKKRNDTMTVPSACGTRKRQIGEPHVVFAFVTFGLLLSKILPCSPFSRCPIYNFMTFPFRILFRRWRVSFVFIVAFDLKPVHRTVRRWWRCSSFKQRATPAFLNQRLYRHPVAFKDISQRRLSRLSTFGLSSALRACIMPHHADLVSAGVIHGFASQNCISQGVSDVIIRQRGRLVPLAAMPSLEHRHCRQSFKAVCVDLLNSFNVPTNLTP